MSELLNPENLQMVKRSNDNFEWFVKHYDELKLKHKKKYIAVDNANVIAEDTDLTRLIEFLDKEFTDRRAILIQYMPEKDYLAIS